ncbi:MAG: HigA family addiction module antitoxin [Leptospirales bacterium]
MMIAPRHPGRILVEEILEPLGITQTAFASHLDWTFARLNEIVNARRGITPDSALALSEAVSGTTPEFWLDLQRDWDISLARLTHVEVNPYPLLSDGEAADLIQTIVKKYSVRGISPRE